MPKAWCAIITHPTKSERFTENFLSLCRLYEMKPIATKVRHPRFKGKTESGVKYVKNNALVAGDYPTLEAWNAWLLQWCQESDFRELDHVLSGPKTPTLRFLIEKPQLMVNHKGRFAHMITGERKVGIDGLIRVDNKYYRMEDQDVGKVVQIQIIDDLIVVSYAGRTIKKLNKTADAFNPEQYSVSTVKSKVNEPRGKAPKLRIAGAYDLAIGWKNGGNA